MALNRRLALAAPVMASVMFAACGPTTPTATPAQTPLPIATAAPTPGTVPSAAPTVAAAPTPTAPATPLPSFSFTPDPALAAEFPKQIQENPVDVVTYHAADIMASIAGNERSEQAFNAFLAATGRSAADVTLGVGTANIGADFAGFTAIRVQGEDPAALLNAAADYAVASQIDPANWVRASDTIGGKAVVTLTDSTVETAPIYLYGHGDTVFTMVASSLSPIVFAALP